jgi:YcxB-like protein
MSGEFTIILKRDDYFAGYWLCTRNRYDWRRLILSYLGIAALFALFLIGLNSWEGSFDPSDAMTYLCYGAVYSMVIVVTLIAITRIMLPIRIGQMFKQLGIDGRTTRFRFDQDEIASENSETTTRYQWSRFISWSENSHILILQLANFIFIALPKSQVAPDILQSLRATMQAAGVRQR